MSDLGGPTGTGLLELNLGGDRPVFNVGMGGIGMSVGQVMQGMGGFSSYRRSLDIHREGFRGDEAIAMRMLDTSGLAETEALYDELMSGEARLVRGGTDGRAETELVNGQKQIYLGDGASAGSKYQLGLTLSHEAFRDGVDNGELGQQQETVQAVVGHTLVAQQVAGIYGDEQLTGMQQDEVKRLVEAQKTGDFSDFVSYVGGAYDSSADYWKLVVHADGTHELIDDGSKELTVEYLNAEGDVISTMTPEGQGAQNEMGWAASLGNLVDDERAGQLLGGDITDPSNYDDQTLMDVFGFSAVDVQILRHDPGASLDGLTDAQRNSLVGEALLKNAGAEWNGDAGRWQADGEGGFTVEGMTLTDRNLAEQGRILAEYTDGAYEYSTVKAEIFRNPDTYNGWSAYEDDLYNPGSQSQDHLVIQQYDLDGNLIAGDAFGGYHTVDNMTTNRRGDNLSQPFDHPVHGNVQGNTIAPGSLGITYYGQSSGFAGEIDGNQNAVLILNNAATLDGQAIGNDGRNGTDWERWLLHSNRAAGATSDWASGCFSDGCFVTSHDTIQSTFGFLESTGMESGYHIDATLFEVPFEDTWYSWYY